MNILRINLGLLSCFILFSYSLRSQDYKAKMFDPSYNFYEVVQEAEQHFESEGTGEGSGFKGFQRWKFQNEPNYYPDGNRSERDMYFAAKQYQQFLAQNSASVAAPAWRDLGPYQINNIAGGYNPGLGRVESFYVNPNDSNLIYLGSRSGGFWRTNDGGQSWQSSSTDFMVASGVNAIAVSPTNPDSILINIRNARNGTSHGVYRSVDGGLTWDTTAFNPSNLGWMGLGSSGQVHEIAYHPQIPHRVYIGTSSGLYVSDDDLQSFSRYLNASDVTQIAFHPTDTGVVYAYNNRGTALANNVLISEDGGRVYSSSATLNGNLNSELHLSVSPVCPDCIYAASNNGVWKALHRDSSFTFLSTPPKSCDGFAVSDVDTSIMVYGMLEIYASYDGGRTFFLEMDWTTGRNPFNGGRYIHADLRRARCINGTFYLATDGYLGKTFNPSQNWTRLSSGTGIRENYMVGVSQSNNYMNICGSQDNGSSVLNRQGWLEIYGADGMEGIIHPLNPDYLIMSYQYGGRRKSTDGGWNLTGSLDHNSAAWEAPMFFDPINPMRVYSFGANTHVSDDFGSSWSQVGSAPFSGSVDRANIAYNNTQIMAVTDGRQLKISVDGGNTFNSRWAGLPNSFITDVCFAPNNDSIILVTFSSYQNNGQKIYRSDDLGNSWQNITYNLGDMPLRSVVVDHLHNANIYVGAEIGVFTMPLHGNTWTLYNQSLPNCSMSDLEIMWGTNTLRGATWGRGLWETDLVGRENHPRIITTSIDIGPLLDGFGGGFPSGGDDQNVRCKIEYSGSLSSVFLKWSANNLNLDSTINMTLVDSLWQTDYPIKAPGNSDTYFKVIAVGSNGDTTETYRFMYHVFGSGISIVEHEESELKVYPNPTSGLLQIETPDNWQETNMYLSNVQGNDLEHYLLKDQGRSEINMNHLASGIYILRWENGDRSGYIKLCKQ